MTRIVKPFADQGEYTQMHNYVLDVVMPRLSANGWKVLSFIIRQTRGWRRDESALTYDSIMAGTGIKSRVTVATVIDELLGEGLLAPTPGETVTEATSYGLNTEYEGEYTPNDADAKSIQRRSTKSGLRRSTESGPRGSPENGLRTGSERSPDFVLLNKEEKKLKNNSSKTSDPDKENAAAAAELDQDLSEEDDEPAPPSPQAAAAEQLFTEVVGGMVARELITKWPECIPRARALVKEARGGTNPPGLLVSLVRKGWTPPVRVEDLPPPPEELPTPEEYDAQQDYVGFAGMVDYLSRHKNPLKGFGG